MKHLKKLKFNAKGFGHVELLVVVAVIAIIGGIGSYVLLKRSSASTSPATVCGSGYTQANTPVQIRHYYNNNQSYTNGPATLYILRNTTVKRYCYVLMSTGSAYGVAKPMTVTSALVKNSCTGWVNLDYCPPLVSGGQNSGTYKYYAYSYIGYSGYASSTYAVRIHTTMTYNNVKYDMYVKNAIY